MATRRDGDGQHRPADGVVAGHRPHRDARDDQDRAGKHRDEDPHQPDQHQEAATTVIATLPVRGTPSPYGVSPGQPGTEGPE